MTTSGETQREKSAIALPHSLLFFIWLMPVLWCLTFLSQWHLRHHEDSFSLPHRGDDFVGYWHRIPLLHSRAFFEAPDNRVFGSGWGYPAPAVWIYQFFYSFDLHTSLLPYRGYIVMVFATLLATGYLASRFYRSLRTHSVSSAAAVALCFVATALTWPLPFALQRGNIEMLLWLPIVGAIWAFSQGRYAIAAVLIGLVASVKLYPIILLALFLSRRRWREIALGLCVVVFATVTSLWHIGPTLAFAWTHLGLGVNGFLQEHGAHVNLLTEGFNHSLFHLIKMATFAKPHLLEAILPSYMLVVGAIMVAFFLIRGRKLPALNQVTILVVSMLYLPATSYDYTLLSLLIPWSWLVVTTLESARNRRSLPGSQAAIVLYAVILGPEIFLTSHAYTYSGTLKSICLGALLILACTTNWDDSPNGSEPVIAIL